MTKNRRQALDKSSITPTKIFYRATACNATHGVAMRKLSVRYLSVCPSVKRVNCDKTTELVPTFLYRMKES